MSLPLQPPLAPMEAEPVAALPEGAEWVYEPKWDGFRCLAFCERDAVALQSKAGRPLDRYFPDVVASLQRLATARFVVDAELLVAIDGGTSFEALQLRLHPAGSRVARLVAEQPAHLLCFDLLVAPGGVRCDGEPFHRRRQRLERLARGFDAERGDLRLGELTDSLVRARRWLAAPAPGRDGVMAKRRDAPYRPGARDAMQKVKLVRSADCVVGGYRRAGSGAPIASLLLGLYDTGGLLHHIGHTSSLGAAERAAFSRELETLAPRPDEPAGFTGRAPGGASRWTRDRARSAWEPVPHRLVVEVAYTHFSGGRFRHGTRLLRRRPDKAPSQCRFDQIPKTMRERP